MSDLFGGLGGLMKGLTSLMPKDDPKTQLFQLQSEVANLQKQQSELYAEIGKQAVEQYGLESFAAADRMKLIQANLAAAQAKLDEAQDVAAEKEKAEKEAKAGRTCGKCGHVNAEGTRFCQECGNKLGAAVCPSCGAENKPGTRFCQECGTRLEAAAASANCPECGHENQPGTRFCGGCGARLEG